MFALLAKCWRILVHIPSKKLWAQAPLQEKNMGIPAHPPPPPLPLLPTGKIQILPRSLHVCTTMVVCCKRGVLLWIRKISVGLPEVQHLYFRVPLSPVVMRKIQWGGKLRRTTSWNLLCGLKCRFATTNPTRKVCASPF